MAQAIEVTEVINNGNTHKTAITKSINTRFIESFQREDITAASNDTKIILFGKGTKDSRHVSEAYGTVLTAMNAAPTTDIQKALTMTVKARQGDIETGITYLKAVAKKQIVEFYADPTDATDTIIVVAEGENNAERRVYLVNETYAATKAFWLL